MPHHICYSEKYFDDVYEYRYTTSTAYKLTNNSGTSHRHVILPKEIASNVPHGRLMNEAEWRKIGVQQSRGWVHYMVHKPGTGCYSVKYCAASHCMQSRMYCSSVDQNSSSQTSSDNCCKISNIHDRTIK